MSCQDEVDKEKHSKKSINTPDRICNCILFHFTYYSSLTLTRLKKSKFFQEMTRKFVFLPFFKGGRGIGVENSGVLYIISSLSANAK